MIGPNLARALSLSLVEISVCASGFPEPENPGFGVIFETRVFFGAKPRFHYVAKYQYYTVTVIRTFLYKSAYHIFVIEKRDA